MDFKAGLYNANGSGITESTDLKIKIKRDADDFFYDFNDSTFKATGWITIAATMTDVDATIVPGEYEYAVDVSAWDDGVYTVYFQYSGSATVHFTDTVEFRIYDGKESVALAEELGTQAKADVKAEADTALSDYGPPTKAEMDIAIASLDTLLDRILGLAQENQYLDTAVFDSNGNMTSCRIRIYSVANSVGTNSNVLATYTITCTYTNNLLTTFKVVKT